MATGLQIGGDAAVTRRTAPADFEGIQAEAEGHAARRSRRALFRFAARVMRGSPRWASCCRAAQPAALRWICSAGSSRPSTDPGCRQRSCKQGRLRYRIAKGLLGTLIALRLADEGSSALNCTPPGGDLLVEKRPGMDHVGPHLESHLHIGRARCARAQSLGPREIDRPRRRPLRLPRKDVRAQGDMRARASARRRCARSRSPAADGFRTIRRYSRHRGGTG
jgi:hypothetical protein